MTKHRSHFLLGDEKSRRALVEISLEADQELFGLDPRGEDGRTAYKLSVLLVAALALRVGVIAATGQLGRSPQGDYREYVIAAQRLLSTGTIVTPMLPADADPGPSAFLPPAYVVIAASAYWLLGVESAAATLFLQLLGVIATTAAVAVVFDIGRILGGRAAGWIAAIVLALNPITVGFCGFIWDTSLFTLGTALCVWISVRLARKRPGLPAFLLFGLWLGGLALLNPALTLAYPLLVLWPIAKGRLPLRRAMAGCVAATIGWAMAIAPWAIRNYVHFGEWMYVRTGLMHELWLGVSPEADQYPRAMFDKQFVLRNPDLQQRYSAMGERAFVNECGRLAKEAIASDPLRYLRLMGLRAVDFWAGTVRTHADPLTLQWWPRSPLRLSIALFALVESVVVLAGMARGRDRGTRAWLLAIALVFSATYIATHIQVRYRAPIEPVLAVALGLTAAAVSPFARRGNQGALTV